MIYVPKPRLDPFDLYLASACACVCICMYVCMYNMHTWWVCEQVNVRHGCTWLLRLYTCIRLFEICVCLQMFVPAFIAWYEWPRRPSSWTICTLMREWVHVWIIRAWASMHLNARTSKYSVMCTIEPTRKNEQRCSVMPEYVWYVLANHCFAFT